MYITVVMADVICQVKMVRPLLLFIYVKCWQMLLPGGRWNATRVEVGRCNSQVADGIATVLCYF